MGGRNGFNEALKQLNAAQVTVHVISYTEMGRKTEKARSKTASQLPPVGSVQSSGIPTAGIDPTMPPTMSRGTGVGPPTGGGIIFDNEGASSGRQHWITGNADIDRRQYRRPSIYVKVQPASARP